MSPRANRVLTAVPRFWALRAARGLVAATALASLGACATTRDGQVGAGAKGSQAGADAYVRTAVRKSSEGVVFFPSDAAQREYEIGRLNDTARALRAPFALCFLQRAIETMEPAMVDGEETFAGVPEGQMKFRARIGADGRVVMTEILESAFTDAYMEECVQTAAKKKRFPATRTGYNKHIDIVYWVSLGFFDAAGTEQFGTWLRKEQVRVMQRAADCLQGRAAPGEYSVNALNLFNRDGVTVANRVERGDLAPEAVACLNTSLKQMRIEAEPDAFVRPVAPVLNFSVGPKGEVDIADARWLELIEAEERALRDEKRRELLGTENEPGDGPIVPAGPGEVPGVQRGGPDEAPFETVPETGPETGPETEARSEAGEEGTDTPAPPPDEGGALRLRPR